MPNTVLSKYLQYSKRIAVFGIAQWAVLAGASLAVVLLSSSLGVYVNDFVVRVVNNVVTCSSALAIAICSGYYAHSAYDNSLKGRVERIFEQPNMSEDTASGNG